LQFLHAAAEAAHALLARNRILQPAMFISEYPRTTASRVRIPRIYSRCHDPHAAMPAFSIATPYLQKQVLFMQAG